MAMNGKHKRFSLTDVYFAAFLLDNHTRCNSKLPVRFKFWLSISLLCCVKFLWHLDVEKLKYRAKSDSTFVVSVEKWASNKERTSSFVLNLVKHLPKMMKKVYCDDCFQDGLEALEDDERSGRPRNVVNEENA